MDKDNLRHQGHFAPRMPWWLTLIVISLVLWAIAFLALFVV